MVPPVNRRQHDRVNLFAQVQITRDRDVHIMSTRDISLGGLFLVAAPEDYPEMRIGVNVELSIFDADAPGPGDVLLNGRIVRLERGGKGYQPGFGLMFTSLSPDHRSGLQRLIGR